MTRPEFIKRLCELEGKKVQVSVGNMREIYSKITNMIAVDFLTSGNSAVLELLIKDARVKKKRLVKEIIKQMKK